MPNKFPQYDFLLVDRWGDLPNSNMTSHSVIREIKPNEVLTLTNKGLVEATSKAGFAKVGKPSRPAVLATVKDTWEYGENAAGETESNILGGFGNFKLDLLSLELPSYTATKENLAFFNCILVDEGEDIKFETNREMPLFDMTVGKNYADDYLIKPNRGGGTYVEYHDLPHYWRPKNANCAGYLILGSFEEEQIIMAGFKIPFGKAVYANGGTIHADSFLVGDYDVVYADAKNFSTVLLKNQDNQPLRISFKDIK